LGHNPKMTDALILGAGQSRRQSPPMTLQKTVQKALFLNGVDRDHGVHILDVVTNFRIVSKLRFGERLSTKA
jgi:hypothetical protein